MTIKGKPPKADSSLFLGDPENLFYMIHCFECKKPLWQTRILKSHGSKVVSTETLPMKGVGQFNRKIENCPLCGNRFYVYSRTSKTQTPSQCYLITDLNNSIQRLV